MRCLLRLLLLIPVLFCCAACADEPERDWDRGYDELFSGQAIKPEYREQIELFDKMMFASRDQRYFGPSTMLREIDIATTAYFPQLGHSRDYLRRNQSSLENSAFRGWLHGTIEIKQADILVVRFSNLIDDPIESFRGILREFLSPEGGEAEDLEVAAISRGRCEFARLVKNQIIHKTAIFVLAPQAGDATDMNKRQAASCINRGHYFHRGFENVLRMPENNFVRFHRDQKRYSMNVEYEALSPSLFFNKEDIGKSRQEILSVIIEKASIQ